MSTEQYPLETAIKIFNDTIEKEFSIRYFNEPEVVAELTIEILKFIKTIRLSTLFSRSGLEYITDSLSTSDLKMLNFVIDLNDAFIFRLSLKDIGAEKQLIEAIGKSFSYKSEDSKLALFGEDFSNNFPSPSDIVSIIENNRWLISIIMFRFIENIYQPMNTKTKPKIDNKQ